VEQHYVRAQLAATAQRFLAVAGLRDDFAVFDLGEQPAQAFPRGRLVIDNDQLHGGASLGERVYFIGREDEARAELARQLLDLDAGTSRPGQLQALADVLQRHAIALALAVVQLGRNRVAHFDVQHVADAPAHDGYGAAAGQHFDAVIHRILEQWLQDEAGYLDAHRQPVHIPLHSQPFAQAQLLDPLVRTRDFDFVLQRDARVRVAQARTEQIGEVLHCLLGALRRRARERRDSVHAVEEEVR